MRLFSRQFEVPHRLRAIVRARELSVIVLALIIGAVAGLAVAAMGEAVGLMHQVFFGLDPGERLSGRVSLDPLYAFLTPCVGGLLFGIVTAYITRRRGVEVDPIEANALHGGRMSMRGSLIVAAQTVWSSGIGASVGLEAGYTQLASGIASAIGRAFRLRRSDMRILVGCGSAAAIAAAFGAPLGGAFYGFELIIGSYSIASLAPVGMASLVGYLTARAFTPDRLGIETGAVANLAVHDVVIAAFVGVLAAVFGILLMRGVAACDLIFTRLEGEAGTAADDRRRAGGIDGDAVAAGDVIRTWSLAPDWHLQVAACGDRTDLRTQGACFRNLAWLRLSRRFVLCLVAARRPRWSAVRIRTRRRMAGTACRPRLLRDHRHVCAIGLSDRRPAHHDLYRAGDHRATCG